MADKEYTLVEIVRDPGRGVYEVSELDRGGHFFLYRYDAQEEAFYRATVPAGAAAIQFFRLRHGAKVPLFGWQAVVRRPLIPSRPHVVGDLNSKDRQGRIG